MGATGNREYTIFSTKYWTLRMFMIMFESHSLPPSCIMYSHASQKAWQSNEIFVNAPISKGERCIIVDAGSKDGFVKGDRLIYDEKSTSGDYHGEINSEKFIHVGWL